jgi:HEAT repeat protein
MANNLFGDAICLKNGATIEGRITAEDKDSITIWVTYGTITIKRSEIDHIIAEEYKPPKPPMVISPTASAKTGETIGSFLDSKTTKPGHKEINKLLLGLFEPPKDTEPQGLFDDLVDKTKKETDYLLLLLEELNNLPMASAIKQDANKVLKWVIEALGRHGVHNALNVFLQILKTADEPLKIAVLKSLPQIKIDLSLLSAVLHQVRSQLVKEKTSAVKTGYINYLHLSNDKESLLLFIDCLDEGDASVRKASANALVGISQKLPADELRNLDLLERLRTKALLSRHKETRQEIMNVLGQLKDPQAVDTLMDFLLDENTEVRSEAAAALANIVDKRTTQFLIERLHLEQDLWTRMQIIGALQKISDPVIIPVMIELLLDDEEKIRQCVARALRSITPCAFGEDYEKWKEWSDKEAERQKK